MLEHEWLTSYIASVITRTLVESRRTLTANYISLCIEEALGMFEWEFDDADRQRVRALVMKDFADMTWRLT